MRTSPPLPGFSRADLHVHTTFSDGTATPEDVLNYYAIHADIRVFAITDHDTIDGALHGRRFAAQHPELFGHLDIIVGEEVSTTDGHVLGLFLKEWIPPGMSAGRTVEAIHAQDAIAIAAHPYTNLMQWNGLVGVGDLIHTLPFDGIEIRNSNFTEVFSNRKAARQVRRGARVGSSDGHFLDVIGRCYTEFPGTTAADLREAILEGTTVAGGYCYGAWTLAKFVWGQLRRGGSIVPHRRDFKREAPAGTLEIKVHEASSLDAAVLTPVGRVDAVTMSTLKDTLTRLAEAKVGVVLDLSEVTFIDSAGVTALVAGMKHARRHSVGFFLTALSPACARTLRGARLTDVFAVTNSVGEARRRIAAAHVRKQQDSAVAASERKLHT